MQGMWPKAADSRRPAGSGHATRGQQGLWDGPALAPKVGLGQPVKVAPAPEVGSHRGSREARLPRSRRAGMGSDSRLGIKLSESVHTPSWGTHRGPHWSLSAPWGQPAGCRSSLSRELTHWLVFICQGLVFLGGRSLSPGPGKQQPAGRRGSGFPMRLAACSGLSRWSLSPPRTASCRPSRPAALRYPRPGPTTCSCGRTDSLKPGPQNLSR